MNTCRIRNCFVSRFLLHISFVPQILVIPARTTPQMTRRRRDICHNTRIWQLPPHHHPRLRPHKYDSCGSSTAVSTSLLLVWLLLLCHHDPGANAWQTTRITIQQTPPHRLISRHSSSLLWAYRNDDPSSVGSGGGGGSGERENTAPNVQTTREEVPSIRSSSSSSSNPSSNIDSVWNKNGMGDHPSNTNDYTGAGTLGDIMSSPHEDGNDNNSHNDNDNDNDDHLHPGIHHSTNTNSTVVSSSSTTTTTLPLPKIPTTNTQTSSTLPKPPSTTTTTTSWSHNSPTKSGLVTTDGGTLASQFGVTSPLDRMALTANGNLQRLFSSYYDAPVHVWVDSCTLVKTTTTTSTSTSTTTLTTAQTWDRVVHLMVHNQTFCTATSQITVHDPQCVELVQSGKVGIGQLFRYLDKLPTFTLLEAGLQEEEQQEPNDSGGGSGSGSGSALWRVYELRCQELSCRIREDFVPHAWNISPLSSSSLSSSSSSPSVDGT